MVLPRICLKFSSSQGVGINRTFDVALIACMTLLLDKRTRRNFTLFLTVRLANYVRESNVATFLSKAL